MWPARRPPVVPRHRARGQSVRPSGPPPCPSMASRYRPSRQRVAVVAGVWDGWAGTGKSTALGAVVDAYRGRSSGEGSVADHVLALSTAAMTAQETARKIGA